MSFSFSGITLPKSLRIVRSALLAGVVFLATELPAQAQPELDEGAKSLVDRIFGPQAKLAAPIAATPPPSAPIVQSRSEREQILHVAGAFQQRIRDGKFQDAYLKASPEFRAKYSQSSWRKVVEEIENRMGRKIGESGPASLELRSRPGSVSKDVLTPIWKCRFPVKFENGDGEDLVLVTKMPGGQFAVVDYSFEARPFTPTVNR